MAYTPADGFAGMDAFTFSLVDAHGAESASALVTLFVQPLIPQVTSISPNSAVAGSAGFTLRIQGSAFLRGAEVLWNGSPRPTTYFNFGLAMAQISASDPVSTPDLSVAQVAVRSPGGGVSSPIPFTVMNARVGSVDSTIASPGALGSVAIVPSAPGSAGVNATVENVDGVSVVLSAAVYSGTPPSGPVIGAGGTYYDLQAAGADDTDSITARFFYPSTVAGSEEDSLRLAWFNGTTWIPVKASGDASPVKETTDNLDGTVSGGRFTVTFDNTSTPRITKLAGTVFAIANTTPVIDAVVGPTSPMPVGTAAAVTVSFQAVGAPDSQRVTFAWDDGTSTTVIPSASGSASAAHAYTAASVNAVRVTVTDANGDRTTSAFEFVVAYDPTAGFVTGGGWFLSPPGAYTADPSLTGKATFGFNSRYQKGAQVPTGNTEFQFRAGNLNFSSTSYEWLVVAGARAQFKGSGQVNGMGGYGFLLTATDGQVAGGGSADQFRLKIWDATTSTVVYDNVRDASDDVDAADPQALGGGSIVIRQSR